MTDSWPELDSISMNGGSMEYFGVIETGRCQYFRARLN